MPTLAEIRQQYPQYQDLTDTQLADSLYQAHYTDIPRDEYNRRLGIGGGGIGEGITNLVGAIGGNAAARGVLDLGGFAHGALNAVGAESNATYAQNVAQNARRMEQFTPPEVSVARAEIAEAGRTGGIPGAVFSAVQHPSYMLGQAVQGVVGAAPALAAMYAAAPITGPIAAAMGLGPRLTMALGQALGFGVGSAAMAYGQAALERLTDPNGPYRANPNNPQAIEALLNDSNVQADLQTFAVGRAGTAALGGALMGGAMGQTVAAMGERALPRIAGAAMEAGQQGVIAGGQAAVEGRPPEAIAEAGLQAAGQAPFALMHNLPRQERLQRERQAALAEQRAQEEAAARDATLRNNGYEANPAEELLPEATQRPRQGILSSDADVQEVLQRAGMTQEQVAGIPYEEQVRLASTYEANDILRANGRDPVRNPEDIELARRLRDRGENPGTRGTTEEGQAFDAPLGPRYLPFTTGEERRSGTPPTTLQRVLGNYSGIRKDVEGALRDYHEGLQQHDQAQVYDAAERVRSALELDPESGRIGNLSKKQSENLSNALRRAGIDVPSPRGMRTPPPTIEVGPSRSPAHNLQWVPVPDHPDGGYTVRRGEVRPGDAYAPDRMLDKSAQAQEIAQDVERRIQYMGKHYPDLKLLRRVSDIPGERRNQERPPGNVGIESTPVAEDRRRPRPMEGNEQKVADDYGLRSFYAGDTTDFSSARQLMNILADKFKLPRWAIGLGAEMHLYAAPPENRNIAGYHRRLSEMRGDPHDSTTLRVAMDHDFASTFAHEWLHGLDSQLAETFHTPSRLASGDYNNLGRMAESNPRLASAWRAFILEATEAPKYREAAKAMGDPYWATNHEMLARATEAALADMAPNSSYGRSFAVKNKTSLGQIRYPQGAERQNIRRSLERVINTLQVTPEVLRRTETQKPGQLRDIIGGKILAPGMAKYAGETMGRGNRKKIEAPPTERPAEAAMESAGAPQDIPGVEAAREQQSPPIEPAPPREAPSVQAATQPQQAAQNAGYTLQASQARAPQVHSEAQVLRSAKPPEPPAGERLPPEHQRLPPMPASDHARLNWFEKVMNTPSYIAEKYQQFRRAYGGFRSMNDMTQTFLHKTGAFLDRHLGLKDDDKRLSAKAAEALDVMAQDLPRNADGTIRRDADGGITLKVGTEYGTGREAGKLNSLTFLSKPGETIKVPRHVADAWEQKRNGLDTTWKDAVRSQLARFGLDPGASAKDIAARRADLLRQSAEAKALGTKEGAAQGAQFTRLANQLEVTPQMLEMLEAAFRPGYTPHMRDGQAELTAVLPRLVDGQPIFKNGRMVARDEDSPLTRTIIIPFRGVTQKHAMRLAEQYKPTLAALVKANHGIDFAKDGWHLQVRPRDKAIFENIRGSTDRGVELVEALANHLQHGIDEPVGYDSHGNIITAHDKLMEDLHQLRNQLDVRSMKAQFRKRGNYAGWIRPENAHMYEEAALGRYFNKAAHFIGDNLTYKERNDSRNELLQMGRPDLYKYAYELEQYVRTPDHLTHMLKGFAFNGFIGMRLASAFSNLTQPIQTTMPFFSAFVSPARAIGSTLNAMKDVSRAFAHPSVFREMLQKGPLASEALFSREHMLKLWGEHRGIYEELESKGILSAKMTREQAGSALSAIDNPFVNSKLAEYFGKGWRKIMQTMPVLFTGAEQLNRTASALAAVRLASKSPEVFAKMQRVAREAGYDHATMADIARFAVDKTQFDMSKVNRPVYSRSTTMALGTQFTQYPLMMFQFWGGMLRAATKGSGGYDRAGVLKMLGLAATSMIGTAGLWGLPGMQDANDIVKAISTYIGPYMGWRPLDLANETQRVISQAARATGTSDQNAALVSEGLTRGPLRWLAGIDTSRRLGISANIGNFMQVDPTAAMGPGFSLAAGSLHDAYQYMLHSNAPMAAASFAPMFIRDLMKAYQAQTGSGVQSPATGDERTAAGTMTPREILAVAAGFTPTRFARESEERQRVAQHTDFRTPWNQRLSNALVDQQDAINAGNPAAAREAFARFQQIRQEMIQRSEGKPHDERLFTAETMTTVRRDAAQRGRGPGEAALSRRHHLDQPALRERETYFPH